MPTEITHHSPTTPPDAVGLLLEFVNTHAGGREEHFADARGLQEWLAAHGFADDAVTDTDAGNARDLRDALQTLLLAHCGDTDASPEAVRNAERHLHRIAVRHPLVCLVGADGVSLQATQTGVDGAFASLLAGVDELARTGAWTRMKACGNRPCREGFFDRTRNGSALYHASGCASMVAMRAYRERRRGAV